MDAHLRLPKKLNRTWTVLGIATVIGLLAAAATRGYLNTRVAELEARNRQATVEVVVAKTELQPQSVLSNQNVALRKIPAAYAHSGAVAPADFNRIDGRSIAYQVKAGEMILWSQMSSKRAPTFCARLASGQRAITVMVDEINSISGMLEPGDLVDLMFSSDQGGRKQVIPLLQGLQVMATGQRSVDDPKTGASTPFATVTFNATPSQARSIILARDTGRLTALLRNPDDSRTVAELDERKPQAGASHRVAAPARPPILVLYGSSPSTAALATAMPGGDTRSPP
ncbi:Flp pilus assembly protein CpaB [Oxalobacteraceae bacterium A2-2]